MSDILPLAYGMYIRTQGLLEVDDVAVADGSQGTSNMLLSLC